MTLLEQIHNLEMDRPLVMGILNVTPDSFSDGGSFTSEEAIKRQIESMQTAGVDIIDIGGESTRPGAFSVSLEQELERVLPVIEWVRNLSDVKISVDTYKTEVMRASIELGVDMINDVNALQSDGAVELVAQANIPVCLMHKKGEPSSMQDAPTYHQVVEEVSEFLLERARVCEEQGVRKGAIILDPGFGFGKSLQHNVDLFERLDELMALSYPLLVGVSRKRMIGELLDDLPVEKRMVGSVAAAMMAAMKGARILRVHDVEETMQALKVTMALL